MNEPVKFWQQQGQSQSHGKGQSYGKGQGDWHKAEQAWDVRASQLAVKNPLRTFKKNPNLPGIRRHTRKNLSWKTLSYIHHHDYSGKLGSYFWRHPFKHGWGLAKTLLRGHSYRRDGDFFLYQLRNVDEFKSKLVAPDTVLVAGFSYCHKPFECPSGRFTDACIHDADNPVCGQCFIGKCVHSLPETRVVPLFITTVHYIGEKMIEARQNWPEHNVLFVITACELTLEMFGKLGNAVSLQGIGVRLDGQICNTMRAFEVSEVGVKPGMAIVTDKTQVRMMELFRIFSESFPASVSNDFPDKNNRTSESNSVGLSTTGLSTTNNKIIATDRSN